MRTAKSRFSFILLLSFSLYGFAANKVVPSTTLAAETGNNTSTANSFQAEKNGNPAAGNVSKVDTRSLLYSGSTTAIYAHYMPWFGTASHINVGYSTTDPGQAAKQVDDMLSRGIQGIIVDWYGRNFAHEEQSTETIFTEVQKHADFKFAIMEDAGALKSADKTSDLIADLIYAAQKYQQSPNYLRWNDRPVVLFFGVEALAIDWSAVRSQVPGNPVFVFENTAGLNLAFSDGAFGWVNGFTSDLLSNWGQSYLASYYNVASKSTRHTVGATWKGFNDSLASWGANRTIGQNCGQTWLNTFSELGKHYSSTNQLESLQLVTWNDYEEGTPIEMGIDNCVSVTGSVTDNTVAWTVTGNENTIHHYTVFVSTDGAQLMPVGDVPAGTHSLDLSSSNFENGAYNVYVKAVGQPSIRNQMSGVIGWTNNSATTATLASGSADFQLTSAPALWRPSRSGTTASGTTVILTPSGNLTAPVTLSCSNLPADVTCSFDQNIVTLGAQPVVAQVTLVAAKQSGSLRASTHGLAFALWFPGLGFGMVLVGGRKRSRKVVTVKLCIVALAMLLMTTGCMSIVKSAPASTSTSSTSSPSASTPSTSAPSSKGQTVTFNIVGQSGNLQRTTTATVTVQ